MSGEYRSMIGSAFCVAAAMPSGMAVGAYEDPEFQGDLTAVALGTTEGHVAIGRANEGFGGYYVVRSEGGSNATLSLFQDNVTEKLREVGSRVSNHLLRNETDFEPEVKSMISENLWELYG